MMIAFRQPASHTAASQTVVGAMMGQTCPVLSLTDLRLAFGPVQVLDGVSFSLGRGEIVAVTGPTGAGKSSLLNVLSGIYAPDHGKVMVPGAIDGVLTPRVLADLGVVRMSLGAGLLPGLSVAQNIASGIFGPRPPARDSAAADTRVQHAADLLGLSGDLDRRLSTLTQGGQRLVALARAIVTEPGVLLLDEPTSGLAPVEKAAIIRRIHALRDRLGLSVVMFERDEAVVSALADRVVVLDQGRKVADGTPSVLGYRTGAHAQYPDYVV